MDPTRSVMWRGQTVPRCISISNKTKRQCTKPAFHIRTEAEPVHHNGAFYWPNTNHSPERRLKMTDETKIEFNGIDLTPFVRNAQFEWDAQQQLANKAAGAELERRMAEAAKRALSPLDPNARGSIFPLAGRPVQFGYPQYAEQRFPQGSGTPLEFNTDGESKALVNRPAKQTDKTTDIRNARLRFDFTQAEADRMWVDETHNWTEAEVRTMAEQIRLAARQATEGDTDMDDLELGPSMEQTLRAWWMDLAADEAERTIPKAVEYSATDLADIGHVLARSAGRSVSDEEAAELGVFFYLQGKLSRWAGAVMDGRRPSDDTIFDIGVYCRMAQRIRAVGSWPGVE